MRPLIDLAHISIDVTVAEKLPLGMALYYLALPMAYEEDYATIVMAHPENVVALARLRSLLQREIVPYQGTPAGIRSAIAQVYPQIALPAHKVLAWSAQSDERAAVTAAAELFGYALSATVSSMTTGTDELEALLKRAQHDRFTLTVMRIPDTVLEMVLKASATPLLFVHEEVRPVQHVLVVMRGFSSDMYALDWVVPLLRYTGATVTLLPLLTAPAHHLNQVLMGNNPVWDHLEYCLQHVQQHGLQATLCWKEGKPLQQQITEEYAQGNYDLMVIPAEGDGDFVHSILTEVARRPACAQLPILVLKPIHL